MSTINTHFSQKDNLQKVIIQNLNSAKSSVLIAVAWFTDTKLFNKVLEIQGRGIKVELIITKHSFNEESHNDFELIRSNGGVFVEIGGDYNTMHHKFCIIDHSTLLHGSFNWTKKANESNNETLVVIKDDVQSINEFTAEFERLKSIAGLENERHQLKIAEALKYFSLINTLIDLGKIDEINPYLHEIKNVPELQKAVDLLFKGDYFNAKLEMELLCKQFTSLVSVSKIEKEEIIFKIKLVSDQIRQLEIEKNDIEALIDSFNRRYILELNPIIASIIEIKKKIFIKLKKLGIIDESFEDLNSKYENLKDELNAETKRDIPDLSKSAAEELKRIYHEASQLCHPDSGKCIFENKMKAQEMFSILSQAYKNRDLETVNTIWSDLKSGVHNPLNYENDELHQLKIKYAALEKKYQVVISDLKKIKTAEPFLTIEKLTNWDSYFTTQKTILENTKNELLTKYSKTNG